MASTPQPEFSGDGRVHPFNYSLLRTALNLFQRPPAALSADELKRVHAQAEREYELSEVVLARPEAEQCPVDPRRVEAAVDSLRQRYPDQEEFLADLERNGLDLQALTQALERELHTEAVIDAVVPVASDEEVEIYYYLQESRFAVPATRSARHILITINDEFKENRREAARERIEKLRAELRDGCASFEALAQKHSECPTAMHGGELGRVPAGKLYPELDRVLFALQAGQCSDVVESEVGFHLVKCDQIHPPQHIALDEAAEKIREQLTERKRRQTLRRWLREAGERTPRAVTAV